MTSTLKIQTELKKNGITQINGKIDGMKYKGRTQEMSCFAPQDYTFSYDSLLATTNFLKEKVPFTPKVGIICGSGLGSLAEALKDPIKIPYQEVPNFPVSTVPGHVGQFVFGYLKNVPVVCMQGRFHYYEGYPLWKCALPVRVMKLCGATHLIATNAAGGLKDGLKEGDIMIMHDHINLMGFAGNNPLQGPNEDMFGPRFLSVSKAYDKGLRQKAKQIGEELGISDILHEGVYTCLGGPNYETVAELRMLKMVGVDAVGMSTVHEVITAKHCDMTVFAFCLITNKCTVDYDTDSEPNHNEVMDVANMRQGVLQKFVTEMVASIGG